MCILIYICKQLYNLCASNYVSYQTVSSIWCACSMRSITLIYITVCLPDEGLCVQVKQVTLLNGRVCNS